MDVKIKDFALIIAALIISSAMLFSDPTRPQPLIALGYITLAIILIGNYIRGWVKERDDKNTEKEKSIPLYELTKDNKHILDDNKE